MKNRKLIIIAVSTGAILLLLILAALEGQPGKTAAPRPPEPGFDIGIPTAQEVRSLVQGYGLRIDETESELSGLQHEVKSLRQELSRATAAQRAVLEALQKETWKEPAVETGAGELPRFRKFEFQNPGPQGRTLHIPAGSFGKATLLTGVYAPVNDEALPVLIRLDAALIGPSRSRIPIREAFLIGKAQGDANSERAVIQLQTLSYVSASGKTVEVPVNGWVIDTDGIQGLQGDYVWRANELAGLAALSGGLTGGASALAAKETTALSSPSGASTVVTGNPLRFAGSNAAAGALSKISEIISRRMEEIIPAVYVPNGREITISFIGGATLTGLSTEEEANDQTSRPFAGLDLDH